MSKFNIQNMDFYSIKYYNFDSDEGTLRMLHDIYRNRFEEISNYKIEKNYFTNIVNHIFCVEFLITKINDKNSKDYFTYYSLMKKRMDFGSFILSEENERLFKLLD